MNKLKRNERIAAMVKILSDYPNKLFTLNYFTERFDAAKSTISEDIVVVKQSMNKLGLGQVKTVAGATGGVKYVPQTSQYQNKKVLDEVCEKLIEKNRILPGGFLYMMDVLFYPAIIQKIGEIFASQFTDKKLDYVVTVETRGIPLAIMTAKALNLPLVILRINSEVTEGSVVSTSYTSATTGTIRRLSLARRAIKPGSKVVIIDDFMRGGGTAKGMIDMMQEFESDVEGIGVLVATKIPEQKMVDDYIPLLIFDEENECDGKINLYPNSQLVQNEKNSENLKI
ncbi:pur operon repressor [Serpentinicella sp. ANB-PHB4]|uniref:pur operon repressor n=1 Tax=Serpentinicella sp. ANB-PHB4 TaxID=3074076 RepID=UPI0028563F8B|nr:pur operon repressor [Serpentinicella sp. ANB-PHB4]MDR5659192.1 pur operon repressor [Serpentinicella sp. ANB-PHB4]